jgi:hypothetical protein
MGARPKSTVLYCTQKEKINKVQRKNKLIMSSNCRAYINIPCSFRIQAKDPEPYTHGVKQNTSRKAIKDFLFPRTV